jgi:23S rRNA pseudouridine1911/1915/1917 synthase
VPGDELELVVGRERAGERLDVFVGGAAGVSRAAAQRLIDAGHVLVDGRPRAKRHAVAAGERVSVRPVEQAPEPAAPPAAA